MTMTSEEVMKYRFKMTSEQYNKLTDEHAARCVETDDPKKPWCVQLAFSNAAVESDLDSMDKKTIRELAKKTHVGALQRAGRLKVAEEFGLVEKSKRFEEHDKRMYLEAKEPLDKLYASQVLSEEQYKTALVGLKESFGIDQG